jgi:hypothetical protein
MQLTSIFSVVFITFACWYIFPSGDICLSGSSISFHTSNFPLFGMVFLYELILPNYLIAISSLLKSTGKMLLTTSNASKPD